MVWKVKIVPHFFLAAALVVYPGLSHAAGPVTMQACGLTVELPSAFVDAKTTGDSMRARTLSLPAWNLIAYCAPNEFRTDRTEAVLEEFKQNGDYLRGKSALKLSGGYSAVVLRRTPAAQPVQRIEAYFSSREFQYHFVLVPDHARSVPPDEWKRMQDQLVSVLESVQIADQEPAITEKDYRLRLTALALIGGAISLGALWLLLRRVLWRRK